MVLHNGGMVNEVKISIRLPSELHQALADQARNENRSLNGQIVHLLQQTASPPRTARPESTKQAPDDP